jgi:hypothetical protein
MRMFLCTVLACIIGLISSRAQATPIEVIAGDAGVFSPNNAAATVLTFDGLPVGILPYYQFDGDGSNGTATLTGSGAIENTSVIGAFAQPAGIAGNFLTIAYPAAVGTMQFAFSKPQNYFGLYWGSIDSYNSITFRNDGTDFVTLSGTDLANLTGLVANGRWAADSSNRYINFYTGANVFDEVVLSTTNFGFEVANIAYGDPPVPVPEPGSVILLGSLLCGFVVVRRAWRDFGPSRL